MLWQYRAAVLWSDCQVVHHPAPPIEPTQDCTHNLPFDSAAEKGLDRAPAF